MNTTIEITLPLTLVKQAERIAEANGITLNELFRKVLEGYIRSKKSLLK
ncbi:MAG TPA: hypothetical protein VEA59_01520 [Patescibacteria group bacterium]|nr:hypothetical protein [Patescibacteria group bacterium]